MTFRDKIKSYIETGDFPTQTQFWEFFDKIPFLDEVTSSRITATGQGQVAIPGGVLVDVIAFLGSEDIVVKCGRIAGGNDVLDDEQINGNGIAVSPQFFEEAGTLFFTGITPTTQIIIFTR